ncbi:hypothetical protein B0H19DRAFT_1067023 [Mycena capillaripes]|nr:hypothetical protein B0H19DRAFT_1083395 [Mycena capillaripes]KAJ6566743.1 hypothetical protein B0H19DRAFT_1067023 [Mycena capillaripes]
MGAAVAAVAAYDLGPTGVAFAAACTSAAAFAAAAPASSTVVINSWTCASNLRIPSLASSAAFIATADSLFSSIIVACRVFCPATIPSTSGDIASPTAPAISSVSVSPISSPMNASARNVWDIDFSVACGNSATFISTENSSILPRRVGVYYTIVAKLYFLVGFY